MEQYLLLRGYLVLFLSYAPDLYWSSDPDLRSGVVQERLELVLTRTFTNLSYTRAYLEQHLKERLPKAIHNGFPVTSRQSFLWEREREWRGRRQVRRLCAVADSQVLSHALSAVDTAAGADATTTAAAEAAGGTTDAAAAAELRQPPLAGGARIWSHEQRRSEQLASSSNQQQQLQHRSNE